MSERSRKSSGSLHTRSVASTSHSVKSTLSEARRNAELSKLKLDQAKRAAAIRLQDALRQAEADAEAARRQAEAEAEAEVRGALEKAEQDALELSLAEREIEADSRASSLSRPHSIPADHPRKKQERLLTEPNNVAPHETRQCIRNWISELSPDPLEVNMQHDNIDSGQLGVLRGVPKTSCAGHTRSPLPRIELPKFDGSAVAWPRWIALFKALVHDVHELTDAERMTYLQSSLVGRASDAVSGLMCSGDLYRVALKELEEEFGNPSAVVKANMDRLLKTPAPKEGHLDSLYQLSTDLHAAVNVLRSQGYTADLAASTNVTSVAAKLPPSLVWRWGEHVFAMEPRQPTLADLDTWLRALIADGRRVADIVEPAGARGTGQSVGRGGRQQGAERPNSSAATAATANRRQEERTATTCCVCRASHIVVNCPEFLSLNADQRKAAAFQHSLRFLCLNPAIGVGIADRPSDARQMNARGPGVIILCSTEHCQC